MTEASSLNRQKLFSEWVNTKLLVDNSLGDLSLLVFPMTDGCLTYRDEYSLLVRAHCILSLADELPGMMWL